MWPLEISPTDLQRPQFSGMNKKRRLSVKALRRRSLALRRRSLAEPEPEPEQELEPEPEPEPEPPEFLSAEQVGLVLIDIGFLEYLRDFMSSSKTCKTAVTRTSEFLGHVRPEITRADLPQLLLELYPANLLGYIRYLEGSCRRTPGTVRHNTISL